MFNFTRKQTIREQVTAELRSMALVLHTYRHRVTGMTIKSYSNPDAQLWVEIS